jgi:hypothetical protein
MIDIEFLKSRPLSYSSLKQFKKSPKHYIHYLTSPREYKTAYAMGNLIDSMLLQPEEVDKRFLIQELYKGTGSVALNNELRMVAQAENKEIISPKDHAIAEQCVKSVLEHKLASELLANRKDVQKELQFKYTGGIPFRGFQDFGSHLDREDNGHMKRQEIIVDLKSARSAKPRDFMRDVASYEYPLQPATYLNYYKRKRWQFPVFYWLVVEKTEPFGVSVIKFDDKDKENAMIEFDLLVKAFKYCMKHDLWHMGYDFWLFDTQESHNELVPKWYDRFGHVVDYEE